MDEINRNYEMKIQKQLDSIEDLLFDWMTEKDLPYGLTIDGDLHSQIGSIMESVKRFMEDTEKQCSVMEVEA